MGGHWEMQRFQEELPMVPNYRKLMAIVSQFAYLDTLGDEMVSETPPKAQLSAVYGSVT